MTGIYKEDCRELMKRMEPNSVDLVVTSPPYDDLREYNNSSSWNMEVFKDIANGLYGVMKDGGVVVWVVNDCTKDGSESLNSFREALYFNEIGFNLNDTMIWCLSGGTNLYVKSYKGVMPMNIKDMVRLKPENVQLWDGTKWVRVIGWRENRQSDRKIRIQLRSGENVYCTKEHRWIKKDGSEVLTSDLKVGDILKSCKLPDECSHNPSILTKDVLWLLGLYIAEGSHADDTIQLALCSDELKWIDRIRNAIESVGGTVSYTVNGNMLSVRCYSKIFNAVISQYIGGRTAKDKHLNNICWSLPNCSLREIVNGYLDGDGHYEKTNNRYRLGFTENRLWERDLRVLSARLGAKLTLLRKGYRIKSLNKIYPSIKGEWRWCDDEEPHHYNEKDRFEILMITEEHMREDEHMWDIEVDSKEHLFSLASGLITHNCKPNPIPQTKQPRYTQCFEYMFVFSKGVPKTFNPIQRVCKNGGKVIKSSLKQITTGKIERKEKTYTSSESISEYNIWEIPVAQNTTDHPAVYPIELVKKHILSWSNPGDLVFDPFLGSGTTGIAAKQLDREFVGTEIDDQYFEIAKERINNAFGNYDAKEKESSIKTLF